MLGFIGFICAAVVIATFGITAYRAFLTVDQNKRWAFAVAFMLLAVNMIIWSLCCLLPNIDMERAMLASDIILLAATGMIGSILVGRYITLAVVLYVFVAAMLLVKRVYDVPPMGYVHDGLLYFNLQPAAKAAIIGLLLFVWLPAIAHVAYKGMRQQVLVGLRKGVILLFASMVIATAILVSARKPAVLILSFVGIVGLFAVATLLNHVVAQIYQKEGSGHAAKQPRK